MFPIFWSGLILPAENVDLQVGSVLDQTARLPDCVFLDPVDPLHMHVSCRCN